MALKKNQIKPSFIGGMATLDDVPIAFSFLTLPKHTDKQGWGVRDYM